VSQIRATFEHGPRTFTVEGCVDQIGTRMRCSMAPRFEVRITRLTSESGLVYEPIEGTALHRHAIEALTHEAGKRQRGE
jgi:hypothetical protein